MSGRPGVFLLAAVGPVAFLAVDPDGWYWFGPVKWAAITVLIPLGVMGVLATNPVRITRAPTAAAGALVAVLAVAAIGGVDPLYAWTGTPERHLGVLAWMLCLLALVGGQSIGEDRRIVVAGGVAIAGAGVGAVAVAEALGWEPMVLDVGHRLTGSFGSSAYLGAATVLLLPSGAGIALDRAMPRNVRIVAGVAVPMVLVAALGSGARAAWVGLVAAGVCLAVARRASLRARPRAAIGVAGLTVVTIALLAAVTPVGARVAATFDANEPGGSGRLDEWRVAARVIADHPTLGVGPEGYRIAFAEGVDDAYEREHGRDPLPDRAHAAPLDITLAGGVPALLAWLAFLGFTARHARRAMRDERAWLAGLAGGLVAYEIAQLLLFPIGEIEPVVWLLAGVLIGATSRPAERVERLVPRSAAAALAVFALFAVVAGGLDIAADRVARDAVDALAEGDAATGYADAKRAASLRPDEVRLRLLEARAATADERGAVIALAAVDRALDRSHNDPVARLERVELLVARAQATLVPDHIDLARGEAEEAAARDSHNAQLLLLAGQAARLDGDPPAAIAAWTRAESLAPRSAAPAASLALLYLELGRESDAAAAADRALAIAPDDPAALEVRGRLEAGG